MCATLAEHDKVTADVTGEWWQTALIALVFALVHVGGKAMTFLRRTPRSAWLSFAGGVSVAYVFVHVLPDLAAWQGEFQDRLMRAAGLPGAVERHVYLVALGGLAVFYGLERVVRGSALRQERSGGERRSQRHIFWLHLASYALYNVLIGYLLVHREESDSRGLFIYATAMSLHFVVNDQGLREHHGAAYDRSGRWLLAVAPVVGWLVGALTEVSPLAVATLFAFLAGGVVLNVLKEELPEDRESRFAAFAAGAAAYSALLLMTQ